MKCKKRFIKAFTIILLAFAAISFSLSGSDEIQNPEMRKNALSDLPHVTPVTTSERIRELPVGATSEPMVYLFQILFILFIISPPLIVVLLFLIWKELKDRNKLK